MKHDNQVIEKISTILAKNSEESGSVLTGKLEKLSKQLSRLLPDGIIVAFSGGIDSAMLLWAAKRVKDENGGRLLAVTTDSPSLSRTELEAALKFAKDLNVDHRIKKSEELLDEKYIQNDYDRCYYCKTELFDITGSISKNDKYKWVLYGYNLSDGDDVRPGHKAALENNVISPLADAGFTKEDIRAVLRSNHLAIAEKAASPCLSSRIMTGISITERRLNDIEDMEAILRKTGIKIFRVRLCQENRGLFLRIESVPEEMQAVLEQHEVLVAEGKKRGYKWVTLDLEPYRIGGGVS
ncbi:ATP-utilizing enzymes of the PP-loop superfamily [Candidatus Scalindua japonica]|uniref:ATP-utilizing enzymes of the PP-loop superfamily n=1 Tax=Candidatus Scalindua japonica TaxID=1284222 RepID=A0A286U196_9BACT|nr:ATP-dependent sacrificial sulfur transferase LarE [Candidatus Scalindua japonica]GAX61909.1 ATP-utilizing enzymes of the PP-loop superfamily [Candidatus Scalindua japonica]